jgi:site-specific recombinase XerD
MEIPETNLTILSSAEPGSSRPPHFGQVDLAIAAWLQAKGDRSGSLRTRATYATILGQFRALLQATGGDLFTERTVIATLAQGWASTRKAHPRHRPTTRPLAPATANHTLAVLSSFYAYALKQGFWEGTNPIDLVERRPVEAYARAQALDELQVAHAVGAIGAERLKDRRDFALLALAFSTGRRVLEIASLTLGNLAWQTVKTRGQSRRALTVTFRVKGGKTLVDALEPDVEGALVDDYLSTLYGPGWAEREPSAPVWVNCSRDPAVRGKPLRPVGIAYLFKQRLGDVHPHQARHSFAVTMDELHAPLSEIQRRLGHSNIATTSRYLAQLRTEDNPYGADVVRRLGLRRPRPAPPPDPAGSDTGRAAP